MRMRKKPNLIPRMERCAEYLITEAGGLAGPLVGKAVSNCALRWNRAAARAASPCETAAAGAGPRPLCGRGRVPDAMVIAMERARRWGLQTSFYRRRRGLSA